jgi:hypothetical protein
MQMNVKHKSKGFAYSKIILKKQIGTKTKTRELIGTN